MAYQIALAVHPIRPMLRLSNTGETGFGLARRLSSQIVVVGRACYLARLARGTPPTTQQSSIR